MKLSESEVGNLHLPYVIHMYPSSNKNHNVSIVVQKME
jgi:hypothetical protein